MNIIAITTIVLGISIIAFACINSSPLPGVVEGGTLKILYHNGHSYTAWKYGYAGGIVHDPDCQCLRNK